MVRVAGVLALTLAACAGSSSSVPPAPTMCSMSDRHGTYLIHTDVVSGNCPAIPDSLTESLVSPRRTFRARRKRHMV